MGSQLSATATVNVSDISPSYQLVETLGGGEGRNFVTTLHCWKPADADWRVRAPPNTSGTPAPASSVTSPPPTSAADVEPLPSVLVRATGNVGEQPELQEWLRQRRTRQQAVRAASRRTGSAYTSETVKDAQRWRSGGAGAATSPAPSARASGGSLFFSAAPSAGLASAAASPLSAAAGTASSSAVWLSGPTASAAAAPECNVPRSLLSSHSNYVQLLLRRDLYTSPLAFPSFSFTSPASPMVAERNGRPSDGSGRWGATAGVESHGASAKPERTALCDIVSKVFVRTANDATQRDFLRRVHRMLSAMSEHMLIVDGTLSHASQSCHNVLFYNHIQANDEDMFCLVERPFIANSLPERLLSRPNWLLHERCFACFQLLQALAQLHEVYGVTHGDIKPSNVLVQSTGWLYLSDLAPFKPNRMPVSNPVLFDYYYDTDDTRCCYVAPEKFVDMSLEEINWSAAGAAGGSSGAGVGSPISGNSAADGAGGPARWGEVASGNSSGRRAGTTAAGAAAAAAEANINVHGHTPAMDVFSAGCVMAYVLTDEPLFRLSDVLELRSRTTRAQREQFVRPLLEDRGAPPCLVPMLLAILCAVDPNDRPTARQLLEGSAADGVRPAFPAFFETLHDTVLPVVLAQSADAQAHYLHANLCGILTACREAADRHASPAQESAALLPLSSSVMDISVAQLLCPILCHAIRAAATDEGTFRGVTCLRQLLQQCYSRSAPHEGGRALAEKAAPQRGSTSVYPAAARDVHALQHVCFDVCLPHLLLIINSPHEYSAHTRVVALRTVCDISEWATAQLWQVDKPHSRRPSRRRDHGEEAESGHVADRVIAASPSVPEDEPAAAASVLTSDSRDSPLASPADPTGSAAVLGREENALDVPQDSPDRLTESPADEASRPAAAAADATEETHWGRRNGDDAACTSSQPQASHAPPVAVHAEGVAEEEEDEVTWEAATGAVFAHNTTYFDDLLLPCVAELLRCAESESVTVLAEVAERLPRLLLAARCCLERRQTMFDDLRSANKQSTYGGQLNALLNAGWALCQTLIHPTSPPLVVAALLRQATQVAIFLGPERTSEDFIPLLTTAVTAPLPVRRELFAQAVLLHALLPRPQAKTLRFFLEEGLRQDDVACLRGTLDALRAVIQAQVFPAWEGMILVHQTLPLLVSPLRLVCVSACRVVETAAAMYRSSEVLAYLSCAVQPLLKQRNVPLTRLSSFLSSLRGELGVASGTTGTADGAGWDTRDFLQQLQQQRRDELCTGWWYRDMSDGQTAGVGEVDADVVNVLPVPHAVPSREVDARLRQLLILHNAAAAAAAAAAAERLEDGGEANTGGTVHDEEGALASVRSIPFVREAQRLAQMRSERAPSAVAAAGSLSSPEGTASPSSDALLRRFRGSELPGALNRIFASYASTTETATRDRRSADDGVAVPAAFAPLFSPGEMSSPHLYQNVRAANMDPFSLTSSSSANASAEGAASSAAASPRAPCTNGRGADGLVSAAAEIAMRQSVNGNGVGGGEGGGATLTLQLPPVHQRGRGLRPIAVALDSQSVHLGAVTAALSLPYGRVLTTGARGDVLMWQLQENASTARYGGGDSHTAVGDGADGQAAGAVVGQLALVERAPAALGASMDGYTCVSHVAVGAHGGRRAGDAASSSPSSSALVALGSTEGKVRLLDVARNSFVATLDCRADLHEGSSSSSSGAVCGGVTAIGLQQDHVLLTTTSDGRLLALDTRDRGQQPVWTAALSPSLGATSCLVPLWSSTCLTSAAPPPSPPRSHVSSFCYGVVVGTLGGHACLFDLRYQRCVRDYDLAGRRAVGAWGTDSFHAPSRGEKVGVLCACPDLFTDEQLRHDAANRHKELLTERGPSLLFGAERGCVVRLFLGSGDVSVAMEPAAAAVPLAEEWDGCGAALSGSSSHLLQRPAVRTLLAQPAFGSLFTGSADGTLRHWRQHAPHHSHTLCCPPVVVSPAYSRRAHPAVPTSSTPPLPSFLSPIEEQPAARHRYDAPSAMATAGTASPQQPLPHHRDAVMALSVMESALTGEPLLLSGARDGTVTVWQNGRRAGSGAAV